MYDKQPSAGTGPRALDDATSHPFLRRSRGILLGIAAGAALTACGPASHPAHPVAATSTPTPTATTPAHAGGGPTIPAGDTSPPGTSVPSSPSSPSGAPTAPATTTPANQMVRVPPIDGETLQQAVIDLHNAGLQLGTTTTAYTAQYDFGLITSSAPPQGSLVQPGSAVNVSLSKAAQFYRHPPPPSVPAVAGDTLAVAEAALSQAGISTGPIVYQQSDSVSQGIVISSSPAAGTTVNTQQEVGLTVSSGPASQTGQAGSG